MLHLGSSCRPSHSSDHAPRHPAVDHWWLLYSLFSGHISQFHSYKRLDNGTWCTVSLDIHRLTLANPLPVPPPTASPISPSRASSSFFSDPLAAPSYPFYSLSDPPQAPDPFIQLCHAAVAFGLLSSDTLPVFVHSHHGSVACGLLSHSVGPTSPSHGLSSPTFPSARVPSSQPSLLPIRSPPHRAQPACSLPQSTSY